ncbi:MAG: FAD-dependent oxidoreductase [Terriglobia bacterium]|nr:MAG: FAD-dependent oxidoreductase [Terriglobia bacterium]
MFISLFPSRFLCISFTISEVEPSRATRGIVIGSGPNGLTAAIELALAGVAVTVHEAAPLIGGGARSAELTLPGFLQDVCSAVHPMAVASPCFERYPLREHGLEWIHPEVPLAHPLDDGTAVFLERSMDGTCAHLGEDGERWRQLLEPLALAWPSLRHDLLAPLHVPEHPLLMARFGWRLLRPARALAETTFRGSRARALFAGIAAHSMLPLEARPSAAIALILAAAGHTGGWPIPRRGSQSVADALASYLRSLGGNIRPDSRIETLPDAPLVMCDITPRQLLNLAGNRFPDNYRAALARYRYGPGVFKLDWALDAPIPWQAAACRRAGTVHLGGTLEEIAHWERHFTGNPFVLLAQPSLFDSTRAPDGKHTAWAYCHVPHGSTADFTDAIESQVERFAPGFRKRILARHVLTPRLLEEHNANLVGGDIGGGAMHLGQFFLRPNRWLYRTPLAHVFLCSSSTPPGGGVHGMCGYHAAVSAARSGLIESGAPHQTRRRIE